MIFLSFLVCSIVCSSTQCSVDYSRNLQYQADVNRSIMKSIQNIENKIETLGCLIKLNDEETITQYSYEVHNKNKRDYNQLTIEMQDLEQVIDQYWNDNLEKLLIAYHNKKQQTYNWDADGEDLSLDTSYDDASYKNNAQIVHVISFSSQSSNASPLQDDQTIHQPAVLQTNNHYNLRKKSKK